MSTRRTGSVSISRTHRSSNSVSQPRVPAIIIITAIGIVYRLATTIVITTSLAIVHKAACQIWYDRNHPDMYPDGKIPEKLCGTPEVDKYYSALFSILGIADGVAGIFGTAASSYLASRFGRKPVFLGLLILTMVDQLCTLLFQFSHGWKQLAVFALILFLEMIGNGNNTIFLINMYVVDITEAEERTAVLSTLGGSVVLGGALAYTIGGYITTQIHNDTTVYLISLLMLAITVVFTAFFLPESFPAEKRDLLRLERLAQTSSIPDRPSLAQRLKASMAIILEPLELLRPTINPWTGKKNWRLVWCTAHIMVVTLADAYALPAMMLFFSTKYKYTPAQTGYVLTTYSLSSVVVLTMILPLLIRIVKPLYNRDKLQTMVDEEEQETLIEDQDSSSSSSEPELPIEEVVSKTSDHLDVHITIGSWTVESLAFILLGTMNTFAGQIMGVASIGLGSGRVPAFRSLVVASVEPLKQGEAMASVEMIGNIGKLFSPIVMGSIMTATISTAPQTIFYVHGIIVAAGAIILFLVRDSDRYQKPAISLDSEEVLDCTTVSDGQDEQ